MEELDNEYNKLLNAEKNLFHSRYNISDLYLDYDYRDWSKPPLGDKEAKEGQGLLQTNY